MNGARGLTMILVVVASIVVAAPIAAAQCPPTSPECVSGAVGEAVDDALDQAPGPVEETGQTAQSTAGSAMDQATNAVEELTSPGSGDPPGDSGKDPVSSLPPRSGGRDGADRRQPGVNPGSTLPFTDTSGTAGQTPQPPRPRTWGPSEASALERIGLVAIDVGKRAAFPLLLALIVGAFLLVQGRIDRRDPKLALAPVDPEQDVLSFS